MTIAQRHKGDILIVDDTLANLDLLVAMLSNQGYKVRAAINGNMALKSVFSATPELILLDINMPEMDGFEVCRQLKSDARTREIPIIFISASDEMDDKVRAFDTGGVDYVTKPFQVEEVLARVSSQLALYQHKRELEVFRQREIDYLRELSAMKDEFVQTVSHDLKNPLSVIMGYADLLGTEEVITQDAEILSYVTAIRRRSDEMYELISNLLDLAKIEAGMGLSTAPMRLDEFLDEQVESMRPLAESKHLAFVYTALPANITLFADAMRLGQVIRNLLSNAIKYTPEGRRVELSHTIQTARILLQVKDTGLGIPRQDLPNIFEKFYRVNTPEHNTSKGTGLGLSIAKAIIEQHRGSIWVESELGKGSTFSIELPLETPA
jgi:two-component system, sensor histidine kinase and response regulator